MSNQDTPNSTPPAAILHPPLDDAPTASLNQRNLSGRLLSSSDISTNIITSLVHKMTKHNDAVDPSFYPTYIRELRSFSALPDLVDALISRYNSPPPSFLLHEDLEEWNEDTSITVRLRVIGFVMTWIEHHWLPRVDDIVLPALKILVYQCMAELAPLLGDRIKDVVHTRIRSMEKVINRKKGFVYSVHVIPMSMLQAPGVTTTENLLASLKKKDYDSIAILDFDAVELARQLTIMESNLYCAIRPEEMLQENFGLSSSVRAINLLSTQITHWISESILSEVQSDNRKKLMEFILSVADVCMQLYNFSTSSSILAAFETPVISRLQQTFSGLHETHKIQLESLKALMDPSENHIEYRRRLRDTVPPAVPCLGLYIADATFCRESYQGSVENQRDKLVNFRKYSKFAQILREMQRFQTPYCLKAIPEVQEYLGCTFDKVKIANVPVLPPKMISLKSVRSSLTTNKTTSIYSVYSIASSRTVSTDYGLYYTRHAISQDLIELLDT